MKKVFSDEIARELGYQKYRPEKSDWILAIVGCLLCGVVAIAIILGSMHDLGLIDLTQARQQNERSAMESWCKVHPDRTMEEEKVCVNIEFFNRK